MPIRIWSIGLVVLGLLSSALLAAAQDEDSLTWDDAPDAAPLRHIGDWLVGAGWNTPAEMMGPFTERPFEVGDETQFSSALYDFEDSRTTYVLRYKSEGAYFWFTEDAVVDMDELAAAGEYFDHTLQPYIRSVFGMEKLPGIDGDPRLHIVHEPYLGFGAVGVFRPEDQCPRSLCPTSNQRDVVYYSLDWGAVNSDEYLTTLTHEYQHVIRFAQDGNERRWMNEGLSQLGEHLSGFAPEYSVGENLDIFLANPDNRLDGWADIDTDPSIYYGSSYLFMVYLYERFGLDFIRALAESPLDGLAAVHHTLRQTGQAVGLDQVFMDWLLANYLDDPFVADGHYYYSTLRVPIKVGSSPIELLEGEQVILNHDINQYGANYFELEEGSYTLLFDGSDQTPIADASPHSGQWMWWGYNAESSIARLTRSLDLREVESATLQFALWYDTERDFDWIDILVSMDGGRKWKALSSSQMLPSDDLIPVAHYSGRSPGWINEKIDLSPFAGHEVLLRFEYATDGSYSLGGILLDDIAIPELGWSDDVEQLDETWQVEGFLRVPQGVAQQWSLAFIQKGKPPTVEIFSLSADNIIRTDLTVPEAGGVLVIGAMAPLTAEKTEYKIVIEAVG